MCPGRNPVLDQDGSEIYSLLVGIRERHGFARLERFRGCDGGAEKLLLAPLGHALVDEPRE